MIPSHKMNQIKAFFSTEPIGAVYLFGSQASGKTHPNSDYDFGVLFKSNIDKKMRFNKRLEYIGKLGKLLSHDKIDVVDLDSAPIQLQYFALAPRKDIIAKNDTQRINFEHRVMSNYFDRLPYIRRHSNISIINIAKKGLQYE